MRRTGLILTGTALVLVLSGCWPVPGQNADRTGHKWIPVVGGAVHDRKIEGARGACPVVIAPGMIGEDDATDYGRCTQADDCRKAPSALVLQHAYSHIRELFCEGISLLSSRGA